MGDGDENDRASEVEQETKADDVHPAPPSFRWQNFRGFPDTEWFELSPIVIIIGPNNSGKSSLVAPLLALVQTHASSDSRTPFVSRGALTNIGSFRDYVHKRETSRTVWFHVRFHHHRVPDTDVPVGNLPPGAVEIGLDSADGGVTARLKTVRIYDPNGKLYLQRSRTEDGHYTLEDFELNPNNEADEQLHKRILQDKPYGGLFDAGPVFRLTETETDPFENLSEEFRKRAMVYASVVDTARFLLQRLLRSVSYLGPMRDRPLRYYEHLGEMPRTVGPRGENTAEVLFRGRTEGSVDKISSWVRRFELADELVCTDTSDEVFDLKLRIGTTLVNIADCGFGVSQLLPILVEGLSGGSQTMLVKQPEIHLNPAQQCKFAEFLAETSAKGVERPKRYVVETHSEHLLIALRRLIAEGTVSHKDVALYFVEREADVSTLKRIEIGPKGHIEAKEWPQGFFGDALRQGLALAAAQSRSTN